MMCSVAAVVCYLWIDRPVATFTSAHTRSLHLLTWTVELHRWADEAALLTVAACGLLVCVRGVRPARPVAAMFLTAMAVITTRAVKDQLQLAAGRTWPETWVQDNPSFIRDGVYRFDFFHGGEAYASFPSGTAATITAVFSVAWFWYPRGRLLYAAVVSLVAATLVTSDYHFLSDIVAGAFLGLSAGWFAIALWETWGPTTIS